MIENEKEIELGSSSIHATHHCATGERFVVVAPPLFEENARLRKVLVNLSRFLSRQGYDVVRFDYFGTGYSPGRYTDVTLERAQTNLDEAITFCRQHSSKEIWMIGVRFGGYLVLRVLPNVPDVRVVAWEPVMNPAAYIKEVLRSEIASQMLIYGEVRHDRDKLVEIIRADGRLHIEGYCISSALYDQLSGGPLLDPDVLSPDADRTALVYWQSRREHKRWSSSDITSHWVDGIRFAYNHIRYLDPQPEPLYQQTLEELRKGG